MALLAPLVLVGPLLLLAEAVVALWRLGPLGWPLAVALVAVVLWTSRWAWRRGRAWWASTRAPARTVPPPSRPRPVPPRPHSIRRGH